MLELGPSLTERDGGRTPDVPGRSTAHSLGLAGLHTLQEVVVLLLFAGLLRPVEEVVLGDGDASELIVMRLQILTSLVFQPDPWEDQAVREEVVEQRVVDYYLVVEVGGEQKVNTVVIEVCPNVPRISESVAQSEGQTEHGRAPQGLVHHAVVFPGVAGILDTGVQREGLLPHTGGNIFHVIVITQSWDHPAYHGFPGFIPAVAMMRVLRLRGKPTLHYVLLPSGVGGTDGDWRCWQSPCPGLCPHLHRDHSSQELTDSGQEHEVI